MVQFSFIFSRLADSKVDLAQRNVNQPKHEHISRLFGVRNKQLDTSKN